MFQKRNFENKIYLAKRLLNMPFPIQLYYIALSQRIFDIYLYKLVEYSLAISNYLFIMNLLHKNILFSLSN